MLDRLNRAQRREAIRYLLKNNASQPTKLQEVPRSEWPSQPSKLVRALRSRTLLVQVYQEENDVLRLSINRTTTDGADWNDKLTWDELQRAKAECGYADRWAVEVYPAEANTVNVANMRHLWLLTEKPAFAWDKKS